jgi:hypothetical protein
VARGIMTGGPFKDKFIIVLYTPCITYEDYCKIMLQTKFDGSCWIIFECSTFKDTPIWWSGWLYILFWTYCPRDVDFFKAVKKLSSNGSEQKLKKLHIMKDGLCLIYLS